MGGNLCAFRWLRQMARQRSSTSTTAHSRLSNARCSSESRLLSHMSTDMYIPGIRRGRSKSVIPIRGTRPYATARYT
ncbi:hypothetical protein K503DRAFT_777693, partial [Rhizopogon vinicolor AM-OR11-026]